MRLKDVYELNIYNQTNKSSQENMKNLFLYLLILSAHFSFAQGVNAYAKVSAVNNKTVQLSHVDESDDSFVDGEKVIIMQMQDDVIGINTNDNANFGLLGDIQSVGLYEVAIIASHTMQGGKINSITFVNDLNNSYHTNTNASVQIISFPTLGSPNYTATNMTAKAWNGNTGGVIAFEVAGTLNLSGRIQADAAGFRGAAANGGGSLSCSGGSNYALATGPYFGDKGEGIFKSTSTQQAAGIARILSGGGGGGSHNGGGGGGSNYSAGGRGGAGWPNCTPSAGGMGGINLSSHISASRVFMGGGAGAGEGNNNGSQKGGNGGGIILIKANELSTTGNCNNISISANGESITTGSYSDGNSGGGAGGAIMLDIANWNLASNCNLSIQANGGNGGDVAHSSSHGGGGGGGQGTIIYATSTAPNSVQAQANEGIGGKNCYTCPRAENGEQATNSIFTSTAASPLPIELLFFDVQLNDYEEAILKWATSSETNNDYFSIERSTDGKAWQEIGQVLGAGSSTSTIYYDFIDRHPTSGYTYYRLKQTDFDQRFSYSDIRLVHINNTKDTALLAYPNPSNGLVNVSTNDGAITDFELYNLVGQSVQQQISFSKTDGNKLALDLTALPQGVYILKTPQSTIRLYKQ